MTDSFIKDVLDEYFKIKDVQKGIQFLVQKGIEAGRQGNLHSAKEIFGIGHSILKKSGVEPAKNAFVIFGTRGQFYCWKCDKMVLGKNGTVGTIKCESCEKTFCPSHIKVSLREKQCPLCNAIIRLSI